MGGVAYLGPQPYICGHCSLRQLLIYPQLESESAMELDYFLWFLNENQ